MSVRAATRDDIVQIVNCNLSAKTQKELEGFAPPIGISKYHASRLLKEAWRYPNIVEGEEIYVCLHTDKIVGYAIVIFDQDYLELDNIDICGKFQGKGFGKELVEWIENFARSRGKSRITLVQRGAPMVHPGRVIPSGSRWVIEFQAKLEHQQE